MFKKILAVFLGLISGMIIIYLVEMIGHSLFPLPYGLDFNNQEQMTAYIKSAPFGALFFVLIAWGTGSFVSGMVATFIHKTNSRVLALICGIILMIFGIINMLIIPTPLWFWILGIIIFIPKALAGNWIALKLSPISTNK